MALTFAAPAYGWVYSVAVQGDGKVLVGGSGGYLKRLNADTTVDTSFNPGASSNVNCLAVQADGKILVGGDFTTLGGQSRMNIGRLHADGTVDTSFDPGVDGSVHSLALQADGKILVGGNFTTLGGRTRLGIGQLNADGTVDATFNAGVGGSPASVRSLAVQADGKVLVGGYFTTLGVQTRTNIGRLNADGTLDTSFNPGASGGVLCLAVQADGKILVGGYFTTLAGQTRNYIGRLHPDGMLDTGYNPGASSAVRCLAGQADGKILVAGYFNMLAGQTRNHIGRLHADGTLDSSFNPGFASFVYSLAVQADGKILVNGGRLNNTEPATQQLSCDGSTLSWLRGGTSPEVWRTSYDYSINGTDWISLGAGSRITGGWERTSVSLPLDASIRARGYTVGGQYNGSSWFVETMIGRPGISFQPAGRTNDAASTVTFGVYAGGSPPLSYQWCKDGEPLADGGNISGSTAATLTLSNALAVDAGGYSVVISNAMGSMTSAVAVLIVRDPAIASQPASLLRDAGESATFSVGLVGTPPLSYQWWKDGALLTGATSGTLTLTNLQGRDTGTYWVVVTNTFGTVTSSVAVLTVRDPTIASHPASLGRSPGDSATFNVTAAGTPPFSYQWWKDGTLLTEATSGSLTLTNLQETDTGSYWVVVSNASGAVTSSVAVLSVTFTMRDTSFNPGAAGGSAPVYSLAVLADGKVLVGGSFTNLGGQPCSYLGRLHADGMLDTSFNPGAGGRIGSLAVEADGKILVGGSFTNLGGQPRSYLGRLHADGTLDSSFNPGASGEVYSLALQSDGKILVGGSFTSLDGQTRTNIGRLHADGTLDTSFNPGASSSVYSLAVQGDGKILVGGRFTNLGGQTRNYLGRLHADGTLDTSFNPGASSDVNCLAVQADGKILVGGSFTNLGGQIRLRIARLHADGTLDPSFNPGVAGPRSVPIYSLAVQADGKILVGGSFTNLDGQTRTNIGRLNTDGTLDPSFNSGASGAVVRALAVQADGKILVGGGFATLGGQLCANIGRLNNTEPGIQYLSYDGSTVAWLRDGTSPEVWLTSFDYSVDRTNWIGLGEGSRIPGLSAGQAGGWQRTGVTLPPDAIIRARGYMSGGQHNGSSWFVESTTNMMGCPGISIQPASRAYCSGNTASFSVYAGGSLPLSYQWYKDGESLVDGAWTSGATTATLALSNVLADAGGYSVVITNILGSVTSAVVALTVSDCAPVITRHPESQSGIIGSNVTFSVGVTGSWPLYYQWRFNEADLEGETNASLIMNPVQWFHEGSYSVVVHNTWGFADSFPAMLRLGCSPVIASQPTNVSVALGGTASFSVTATITSGCPLLTYQWHFNGTNLGGETNATLTLTNVQLSHSGFYRAVVSNLIGTVTSSYATLSLSNALAGEPGFNVSVSGGEDEEVLSLAVQPDGKILFGGGFRWPRNKIGRLNADGAVDTSFNPRVSADSSGVVVSLAVQNDGKIVVGGYFMCTNIGRLNTDGTPDPSFRPGASSAPVYSLSVQADGKILVGGGFTMLAGQTRNYIGRLHADGTLDTTFNPGGSGWVHSLAVQGDGKILVGGDFSTLGGQPRTNIGRLNADGTLDASFNPGAGGGSYAGVRCLALQADGKILVGGTFTNLGGQPRTNIGRLNADGSADPSFNPRASASVLSLAVQADGKILVGGSFTTLGGQSRRAVGRLHGDGTLDTSFDPGADYWFVYSLAVQPDGRILVGGMYIGQHQIRRLNNNESAIQHLRYDGSILTWLRGGAGPEVWRTTFEHSSDGLSWTSLGAGVRINGGWQLEGLALPPGGTIRARGHVTGGQYNGSSWFAEAYIGAPVLVTQPCSRTNAAGTTATFSVLAGGSEPLSYLWHKNGAALADGGTFAGTTTPTLSVTQLRYADEGDYTVVVNNAYGMVTSQIAQLTVLAPPIVEPLPASTTVVVNSNVTLTIDAIGTLPFRYQWRKNGVNIPGATNAWLTITNVQFEDGGSYSVVVANSLGAVTSDPTLLVVEVASQAPPEDDFVNRRALSGTNGFASGTNLLATRQVGEPDHGGKHGSNSVWYAWRAPATGIATFRTVGSTFDTLLGVYTNDLSLDPQPSILNLVSVAEDEDRGGYLTSQLRFNALKDSDYQVAIDGFAGGQGTFILSWELEPTVETLPVIPAPPEGQVVLAGSTVTFSVTATGSGLSYQWYFNGAALTGATDTTLTLTNVDATDVGFYTVRVGNALGRWVESLPAALEIGSAVEPLSQDKLEDWFGVGTGGGGGKGRAGLAGFSPGGGFISVAMGTINYRLINNTNAVTQAGEPNLCGTIGRASKWLVLQPETNAVLVVDTMGSSLRTALAAYRSSSLLGLATNVLDCDVSSAADGVHSRVRFDAQGGCSYLVVVDSLEGEGLIALNWVLGQPPVVVSAWTNAVVPKGASLTLGVTVSNAVPPAHCQWRLNGEDIPGATNTTLALSNVQRSATGLVSVVVVNAIEALDVVVANVQLEPVCLTVAQSGFDSGDDQWQWGTELLGSGAPGSGWQPAGHLAVRGWRAGEAWWWKAPPSFGVNRASYGGWLEFDLQQSVGGTNRPVVRLIGAGGELQFPCGTNAGGSWTHFRVPLRDGTGWQREHGESASPRDLEMVLAGPVHLEISGTFEADDDEVGLDNVSLVAPAPNEVPAMQVVLAASQEVLVLEWPVVATEYRLETTVALDGSAWMTNLPGMEWVVTNQQNRVTVPVTSQGGFFRLKQQ